MELAEVRIRYGYKRIDVRRRRDGWLIYHKHVRRLYCELGMQLRSRRHRRHVSAAHLLSPKRLARRVNEAWGLDFMADQLFESRRIGLLTVVDVFTRESLAIEVGPRLRPKDVIRVLTRIAASRGAPKRIYCDNGSELQSQLVALWAYTSKVQIEFSRPGKPTDNAHIESFNGGLRDACLIVHWFASLGGTNEKLDAWLIDYNESRSHKALDHRTPEKYATVIADEGQTFSG